jgi:hypothetical protein
MKTYKLDIFKVLSKIDNGDVNFIDTLSEEELKSFTPFVVQNWLYGSTDDTEIRTVLLNELTNRFVFSLQKHPKLLYKLFCTASGFGETRHYYPKAATTKRPLGTLKLLMAHYGSNERDAIDMLKFYNKEDIKELAEYNGYQEIDVKKLLKEW